MEKRELIICRGIQGSGKSTWAKQWAKEQPETRIRINFDDMRNMLGEYWVTSREKVVSSIYTTTLAYAMEKGYSIVVDNMNLNPKTCAELEKMVNDFNNDTVCKFEYEVKYKDFFDIPLEECIRRDSCRPNPIGAAIIKQTHRRYRDFMIKSGVDEMVSKMPKWIDGARSAIIVDMDATLCLNTSGRPFFGEGAAEGMLNDVPVLGVVDLVKSMYKNGHTVIIVTGREGTPEIIKATHDWLNNNQVPYDFSNFRPIKDFTSGEECKRKIYQNNIKGKYNIALVLEDSKKCVKMWREEGLICLQPNDGCF